MKLFIPLPQTKIKLCEMAEFTILYSYYNVSLLKIFHQYAFTWGEIKQLVEKQGKKEIKIIFPEGSVFILENINFHYGENRYNELIIRAEITKNILEFWQIENVLELNKTRFKVLVEEFNGKEIEVINE